MEKQRDSGYEWLRIIAAIMITFNHVTCSVDALPFNALLNKFFIIGGKTGAEIFLIVGCWFLVDSRPDPRRILRIIAEICFYAVALDLFVFLCLGVPVTPGKILRGFHYWYPVSYAVMLFVSPALLKLSEKNARLISAAGAVLGALITAAGVWRPDLGVISPLRKEIIFGAFWASYLFILIRCIKHKKFVKNYRGWQALAGFIAAYGLMYLIYCLTGSAWIRSLYSPLTFFGAFSLVRFVSTLKIGFQPLVNRFARCTFAVYLLQCNRNMMGWIWNSLFKFDRWSETTLLYGLYAVGACLAILAAAFAADTVRVALMRGARRKAV